MANPPAKPTGFAGASGVKFGGFKPPGAVTPSAGAAGGAAKPAIKFGPAAPATGATGGQQKFGITSATTAAPGAAGAQANPPTTAATGAGAAAPTGGGFAKLTSFKPSASVTPGAGLGAKPTVAITPGTTTPGATAGGATAGGAATTTAKTTTAAATTTTAAPTTTTTATTTGGTPKIPSFGPKATGAAGTTTTGTGTTTTGTTTTTTTAAATTAAAAKTTGATTPAAWKPNVDIPSILKGKTLGEMINEWSAQIDADIYQFTQMAMLVGEWDKKVSANSKKILDLKHKVDMVEAAQSELTKNLEMITAQQAQLSQVLTTLEQAVEKWSLTVDLGPQDAERERGYALADDIDVQLNQMAHKLKEMIDRLNANQDRESAKEGEHPAFQILQILDSHLNSLSWIDNTSNELSTRLAELQSQFSKPSSASMNADSAWTSRYY